MNIKMFSFSLKKFRDVLIKFLEIYEAAVCGAVELLQKRTEAYLKFQSLPLKNAAHKFTLILPD